jgi:hypothetical protein
MTQSERSRIFVAAVGAVATIGLFAGAGDAFAARRKKKKQVKPADVRSLQTPLGLQGTRGAGNNVVSPFSLVDRSRRKSDVEAEYGVDVNGDGVIADGTDPNLPSEYFPATEDRRDTRNTRKNKKPQLFSTAGDIGSSHAFVWNSGADLGTAHYPTIQILYTPQGRPVPDPNNPGSFLFDDAQAGVKLRLRAKAKKGGAVSAWSYTDAFALNNNTPPSMTIDEIIPNDTSTPTASDEVVEILWTAYDDDSEDKNGNGVLDPLDLEDTNGNGVLDPEFVSVAFDYFRVPDGLDPSGYTPDQLDGLAWQPCSRAEGVGDPDDGVPSAPEGVGRQHTFAWDSLTDVGTVYATFILRAKPFDEKNESGEVVYFTDGFVLDNHTVFNHPNTNADFPAGRVGTASVNLVAGLPRSSPQAYAPPAQAILLTGGSSVEDGPGSNYLAVIIANSEDAETTEGNAVPYVTMGTARSYHTATLLDDGRVLLTGGIDAAGAPTRTTEIFDPATNTIGPGPDMTMPRAKHAAVRLASGDVLLVGGMGAGGSALATAEIFHMTPDGAPQEPNTPLPDMAVAQHSLHAHLLPNQSVLVTGGIRTDGTPVQLAQVLDALRDFDGDPTTKEPDWDVVSSMLEPRLFSSSTSLIDGNVLFAGGSASPSKSTMELYNWLTREFEPVKVTMPDGGRAQHAAALLGDGSVLLAGGTPDPAIQGGGLVAGADVFHLGERDNDGWNGSFSHVNGDMKFPRRLAETVTINNGRVYIVGGINTSGGALSELEVYTPRGGRNLRPFTRTELESNQQSWAFGAPIVYRATDPEQDDVRVVVQWSDDNGDTWNAAAPQAATIGGDVAELTAPVTTGAEDDQSTINPRAFPVSDHNYIWAMVEDIPRPPQGGSTGPYIFRTIPYGAVQGDAPKSLPVTVLYNTKVIPTVLPLENRHGVVGANQGGDIHIWVHFRDIDGQGSPSNGDEAEALFEFAVDENGDGIINDGVEFYNPMSRSGAAKFEDSRQANRLVGIQTYSEAWDESGPDFGDRLPENGWQMFPWDSVFDLGAPASSRGDVFIRVRPFDNLTAEEPDEGFTASVFNEPGQDEKIRVIRDPEAMWLEQFEPAGGDPNNVAVEEPLLFHFNGLVDADTVNEDTIQIRRNGVRILGVFTTEQNVDDFRTLVTFFPLPNSTTADDLVYEQNSNPTVLFPFNDYSIFIPGYHAGGDYPNPVETLLPADLDRDETYALVQNVEINTGFTTGDGNYDDGRSTDVTAVLPVDGTQLVRGDYEDGITISYDNGIDIDTVASPNLRMFVDTGGAGVDSVIPFRRTITNTQDPVTGLVTSTVTLLPMIELPSGRTIAVLSNSGLLGANGQPVQVSDLSFSVASYGRTPTSSEEDFESTTFEDDAAADRAAWGTDPCNPGALTALQSSGTPPQGGADLVVGNGQVATITAAVSDYNNIDIQKGGTLRIRASAAAVIRATGDITIAGTVGFRGEDGWTATHADPNQLSWYQVKHTSAGTRKGGAAFNGAGKGGDSVQTTKARTAGSNGSGVGPGQGGRVSGSTSQYYWGVGGGAGAGHGAAGLAGGRATSSSTAYGAESVPGSAYGDPTMIAGPSAGSGGGGGGSNYYGDNYGWAATTYAGGGGGGAGAGSVTFVCDGTFDLKPSGYVDGRGGGGGGSTHYAGSGGGGSGGGLKVTAGTAAHLDGIVDLRGGRGGPAMKGYYSDWRDPSQLTSGTSRYGGDGAPGRFVAQAPNFADKDDVRVKGQLIVEKIDTIPTTALPTSTVPGAFATGGTVSYGTATAVHYDELVVADGVVVDLEGSNALTIYAENIDVQGTLRINGQRPTYSFDTARTSPVSGGSPLQDYYYGTSPPTSTYKGADGTLGGGDGGDGFTTTNTASANYRASGTDGEGPGAGTNANKVGTGWNTGSTRYMMSDAGGGGGGNATPGDTGWTTYAAAGRYNYLGMDSADGTTGRSPTKVKGDVDNGGPRVDAITDVDDLEDNVGAGGGGGNAGAYLYSSRNWNYYGMAASAGSGAGALGLVAEDTVTVSGTIEAIGGDGNVPGGAYGSSRNFNHSGGGGGSGGTVVVIGDAVSIAAVTDINNAASGATIDLTGGQGGGWRQLWQSSGTRQRYPTYNSFGNFGGDGGFGRLIVQYKTSLNDGAELFNRGGLEHVAFDDPSNRFTVLSGSARGICLGGNDAGTFKSTWYDLETIVPIVNDLYPDTVGANTGFTMQGEGAQSDPHDPGEFDIGAADPNNTSGFLNPGTGFLNGWRFLRFSGTLSRASADPTQPAPFIDDVQIEYETDDLEGDE